jgi:hypothetical protein
MGSSKLLPEQVLKKIQQANPNATAAEIQELMRDEFHRSPELWGRSAFEELFKQFITETGYRGSGQDASEKFLAWLNKPKN